MNQYSTMPAYVCPKTVWALQIDHLEGTKIFFREAGFAPVESEPGMFARYVPGHGDYYVVSAEGYKSISPKAVFEEGYTKKEQVP